ncbi:hypothetical protein F0562_032324 [Nyssa sinensis]|uniref:Uncharacterized protein n=1 Tax=Nyssa sinensis TaxID=561372 RepID=A0A5J5ATE6_9ASTE|nr:hypothetical protein F0562_032324 [Nyssa sinensis]
MDALSEIRYESHDFEAQLQLQLMSSTEAANKVEELKKILEEAEMELGTYRSLTDKLKGQLAESSSTIINVVIETAASKTEAKHHSEIEATKVAMVNEQKDKILKLGRKLASDGYNLCLKKMDKAFPKIDTEVLDHIEVSDVESEDFEDDEVSKDPAAPIDP